MESIIVDSWTMWGLRGANLLCKYWWVTLYMAGTLYPQFCICPIQQSELYSTIYAVYLLKIIAFKYKQIVLEAKKRVTWEWESP